MSERSERDSDTTDRTPGVSPVTGAAPVRARARRVSSHWTVVARGLTAAAQVTGLTPGVLSVVPAARARIALAALADLAREAEVPRDADGRVLEVRDEGRPGDLLVR